MKVWIGIRNAKIPVLTFFLLYSTLLGFNSSAKLVRINTMYYGQCYLIKRIQNENNPTMGSGTALILNLLRNNSAVWLYLLPNEGKSENSAVVGIWHHPVDPLELRNDEFLRITISKALHVKRSTQADPCTRLEEATYYEVKFHL